MPDVVGIIVDKSWKKNVVAENADAEPLKSTLDYVPLSKWFWWSTFRL